MLISCPHCRNRISPDAQTCPNCGLTGSKLWSNRGGGPHKHSASTERGILRLMFLSVGFFVFLLFCVELVQRPMRAIIILLVVALIGAVIYKYRSQIRHILTREL